MKKLESLVGAVGLSVALCCGAACNIHDNTINIPNATINATTDASATNVAPAQAVPITITTSNVFLIDPAETPPPEHVNDAGHIVVYLDDVDTTPLMITAMTNISVTIPPATKPGPHKLICRFHKHDGTPIGMPTTTKFEVSITVTATTDGDGGVDIVTSVDANVTDAAMVDVTTGAGGAAGAGGAGGAG